MKDKLMNTPITELYNSLFNVKDKLTSAEWVEISNLLMEIHKMKTIVKWETKRCDCCPHSDSGSDTSSSEDEY